MLIYERLYPSRYKSRLYPIRYKRNEGGNDEVLITVWLEAKDDLISRSCNRHVTMALQLSSLLDVSSVKCIIILIAW